MREAGGGPILVALDVDAGWWPLGGRIRIGARRSPVRTPEQAAALAREVVARPELRLDGLMSYEAHIAGVGDRPPGRPLMGAAIRAMQRASVRELAPRRAAVVAAVSAVAPLRFVNGGGTGSVERTAAEPAVTEVAAGSGLYGPTLFDAYSSFSPAPAALFALPVVRRPDGRHGDGARRRLPGLRRGRRATACRRRTCRARPAARPPGGRGRGPDAAARARAPRSCGSATWCGCATPRRASCASGSTRCTWCGAASGSAAVPTYRGEGECFL